jgi:hypothetical protein
MEYALDGQVDGWRKLGNRFTPAQFKSHKEARAMRVARASLRSKSNKAHGAEA